jgi:hypothetical protein
MVEDKKLSEFEVKKMPSFRINLDQLLGVSVPISGALAIGEAAAGRVMSALVLGTYSLLIGRFILKQWS